MPKYNCIYRITNLVNGNIYIGSARVFHKRKATHLHSLRKDKHPNKHLQSAFNKYGEDKFIFDVLEANISIQELILREQIYIDELKPKYNKALIAGRPPDKTGKNLSTNHKKSISNALRFLTREQVLEIRSDKVSKNTELGRKYNICPSVISRIKNNKRYTDV